MWTAVVGVRENVCPHHPPVPCASGERRGRCMGEITQAFPCAKAEGERDERVEEGEGPWLPGKKVWMCLAVPGLGLGRRSGPGYRPGRRKELPLGGVPTVPRARPPLRPCRPGKASRAGETTKEAKKGKAARWRKEAEVPLPPLSRPASCLLMLSSPGCKTQLMTFDPPASWGC